MERRRRTERKRENHERWVISYADFTTLLLATFVVMYAVSSINSSKFQEMAEAFSTAFMGRTTTVRSDGYAAANKGPFNFLPSPVHTPVVTRDKQVKDLPPTLKQVVENRVNKLNAAYENLTSLLATMIDKGQIRVSLQSLGVVIDINAVLLFDSGKAELTPQALDLIDQIGGVLKDLPYQIQVNGFTDNAPIHTAQFSSNWDLSATRAISVVKRFVVAGVNPALLVGAGYGEYHPVAPNGTPENMALNRRVSIVVVSPGEGTDPEHTPLLGGSHVEGASGAAAPTAPASGDQNAPAAPAADKAP
jgi:chemotaxis protein MotB